MQTNRNPASKPAPLFALGGGTVLALIAIGAALLLRPSETDLIEGLVADGHLARVREIVAEQIGHPPDEYELLEFALTELRKGGWDEDEIRATRQIVAQSEDAEATHKALREFGADIPDDAAATIFSTLARRSLAQGNPAFAAEIYGEIAIRSGMSDTLAAKLVESLRFSEQPGAAFDVLTQFKEQSGGQLHGALIELYDIIALESGHAGTAFRSMRDRFAARAPRDKVELRKRIDQLIAAGSQAGQSDELITLCDEFLASTEADALTWEEIFERRRQDPSFDDPAFREIAGEAANFCRWNNQPDKAFDYLRKFVALGNYSALDACVELHKPLLREREMADLLRAVVPVKDRDGYTLLAAQLHSKLTQCELADSYYRQFLEANPEDAQIWAELAGMWDATGEFDKAITAYRRSAEADPDNATVQSKIARTLVTMGLYDETLEHFSQLDTLPLKDQSQYYTLATNLGNAASANDAMLKLFRLPGERSAIDYDRLARSYIAIGNDDKAIEAYRAGIKAYPRDRDLRLALAHELAELRRYSESMALLGNSSLRSDPEVISLYLQAALALKKYSAGLSFAGGDVERQLNLTISAKLSLAEIYYHTGSVSKSMRIYDSIPTSEIPLPTRAAIAFRKRDYAAAERLQESHLNANPNDHSGWSFLGSVYQAQLKKQQAKDAYQRALSLLKNEMARR